MNEHKSDSELKPSAKDHGGGQLMFRFEELVEQIGDGVRNIEFTCDQVQPLGYAALAQAKLNTNLTFPIVCENSKVIGTDIEGIDQSKTYTMRATLQSNFTSRAIGLVKGGWLPSALAVIHNQTIVLVDRNIVSEIRSRFNRGSPRFAEPDFLDLFADLPVRINPLLFAMEGNTRAVPTPEQMRAQVEEAAMKLKAALPSAEVMADAGHIRGALALLSESRVGIAQKQSFLLRLSSTLSAPVSSVNMCKRWNEVLATTDECAVPRLSLVVLAALSSVVVPNGGSPAKKLLNFQPVYSEMDAYNAICDLHSLEILICGLARFPEQPIQVCTADKSLALFWTGIGASNFGHSGNNVTFDLSPVKELLPEPFLEEWNASVNSG